MATIRVGQHVCEVTELPDVEALKNNLPSGIVHQIEKQFMDDTETGAVLATIFVIARSQFPDVTFEQMLEIPWGEVEKFTTGLTELPAKKEEAQGPPEPPAAAPAPEPAPPTPEPSGDLSSSAENSAT